MCMEISIDDGKDNSTWNVHAFMGYMLHFIMKMLIIQFYENLDFLGLGIPVCKHCFDFALECEAYVQ